MSSRWIPNLVAALCLAALAGCGFADSSEFQNKTGAPAGRPGDEDGDGLLTTFETSGWTIQVDEFGLGVESGLLVTRFVESDPNLSDTDADGLDDELEYYLRTDPSHPDTDGDGLTDLEEYERYGTSPMSVDTDGDATGPDGTLAPNPDLFDGNELRVLRTSPSLADTDGDNKTDFEEYDHPIRSPLIAELPAVQVNFEGEIDIRLRVTYAESEGEESTYGSEYSTTNASSSSQSDSTSTAVTIAASSGGEGFFDDTVGGFLEGGLAGGLSALAGPLVDYGRGVVCDFADKGEVDIGPIQFDADDPDSVGADAAEVGSAFREATSAAITPLTELGACDEPTPETTTTTTSTLTTESSRSATEAYSEYQTESRTRTETTASGEISVGASITNDGIFAVTLSDLYITMMQYQQSPDPNAAVGEGGFRTLATLIPDGAAQAITLSPGETSPVIQLRAVDVNPEIVKEFLRRPRAIFYAPAGFELTNADGINFKFLTEETIARTAAVVIDYGQGLIERYQVATNVDRYDENGAAAAGTEVGDFRGIRLGTILRDIVGVPFETVDTQRQVDDGTGNLVTRDVVALQSIRGVANVYPMRRADLPRTATGAPGAPTQFWMIHATRPGQASIDTDFEDIVLMHGEEVRLIFVQDADGDGLFAREEQLNGTFDSTRDQFTNASFGTGSLDPTPDGQPDSIDSDRDGLSDYKEVKVGWRVCIKAEPGLVCPPENEPIPGPLPGESPLPVYQVYCDPSTPDSDRDGWTDLQEFEARTDPNNRDTDDDGLADCDDPFPLTPARILYVNAAIGFDSNEGDGWDAPFETLDAALSATWAANSNGTEEDNVSQIWVAAGTYAPDYTSSPMGFSIPSRVSLYGGFAGGEFTRDARNPDPLTNGTILFGGQDGRLLHVVDAEEGTQIDGFTVLGGQSLDGGGLYAQDSAIALRNMYFTNNSAVRGGAIHARGGHLLVEDCRFLRNEATSLTELPQGGAVWATRATLRGCRFEANSARDPNASEWGEGTAILIDADAHPDPMASTLVLEDCEFEENGFTPGSLSLEQGLGALFVYGRCDADVRRVSFSQNKGGCIVLRARATEQDRVGFGPDFRITNSTFYDNLSGVVSSILSAPGFYSQQPCVGFDPTTGDPCNLTRMQASVSITNCTGVFNTSIGGNRAAVGLTDVTSAAIRNSIFWDNGTLDVDLRSRIEEQVIAYSLIGNVRDFDQGPFGDPTMSSGLGNLFGRDPLLVSASQGDFRLADGSPCIDRGSNFADTDLGAPGLQLIGAEDLDGNARIQDGDDDGATIIDMGAFEFPGAGTR